MKPAHLPKQYSAPAKKTAFRASTHDDSDHSSDSGYATSTSDGGGHKTEDSVDALYRSYNVMKDAHCSLHNRNAYNTITVQAHLEYEDRFAGFSRNQRDRYIICDNGADTWVIGDGWTILEEDPIRTANLVAFDPEKMRKNGCPIVTAATTIKDANGSIITIVIHNAVHNKDTFCSEFQTQESGISIDSVVQ